MNKLKKIIKSKWLFGVIGAVALIALILNPVGVQINQPVFNADSPVIGQSEARVAFTIGTKAYASSTVDYSCDGVADDVQFQDALDALPATGGKLVILAGNYNFTATVSRAIDNVTIVGMGFSTYIARDGVNPIFTVGAQSNWSFINIRFDAGGINDTGASEITYENVDIGGTHWAYDTSHDIGAASWDIPTGRGATLIVAASDADVQSIAQADYWCDGIADEVQINAALTALPATGGAVVLMEGTYTISAPIVLVKNSALRGVGGGKSVQITLANNSDCNMIYFQQTDASSSFIYVGYLLLLGNKANQASGNGILFEWDGANVLKDFEIERVYINSCKEDGIKIDHAWGGHIHGCNSESNGGDGYDIHGNQTYVYSNYASECGGAGFYISSNDQFYSDCYALHCARGFQEVSASGCRFSNCRSYDSTNDGFYLNGDYQSFSNCSSIGDANDAFDLNAVNHSQFVGGSIRGISGTWVNGFNVRSSSSHISIIGFDISDCSTGILEVAGCSNNQFQHNTFDAGTVTTFKSLSGSSPIPTHTATEVIPADSLGKNPTNPPAVDVYGVCQALEFTVDTDKAYYKLHVPDSWVSGTDMVINIFWTRSSTGSDESGKTVKWQLEYIVVSGEGDNVNSAGTTISVQDTYDSSVAADQVLYVTGDLTIPAGSLSAGGCISLELMAVTPTGTALSAPACLGFKVSWTAIPLD